MSTIVEEVAAVLRERYPDTGWLGDDLETVRDLLHAFLAVLESRGLKIVPVEITEDMANEMECQFSTERQWAAALAAAPKVEVE